MNRENVRPRLGADVFKLLVKSGVGEVHIFLIQALFGKGDGFAKTLEMDNFTFAQEADDIVDIRIIGEAENVVVGESGLLFCYNN